MFKGKLTRRASIAAGLILCLQACAGSALTVDPRFAEAQAEFDQTRFFGGQEYRVTDPSYLGPGMYDSVVALVSPDGERVFCSGVLVDPMTVLTAAHCVCRPSDFLIAIGETARDPRDIRAPRAVRMREGANCASSASRKGRDLALITLNLEVPRAAVGPATLARTQPVDSIISDRFILITGFGAIVPGGAPIGRKAGTVVPLISSSCSHPLDSQLDYDCVRGRELVALSKGEGLQPDSCGGDSGGPAWIRTVDDQLVVAAIVSRGIRPTSRCGDGGIYTLVTPEIIDAIRNAPEL